MRKSTGWKLAFIFLAVTLNPMSAYAGTWKNTSAGCQYQKDDGNYATAEWITENGTSYYLNQNGIMAVNTTTPDGYLVAADGSWVTEQQSLGGYVRTPYDNRPYYYDPEWQVYIFDDNTDYAWVNDTRVLAAVRGIIPASELSEKNQVVYEEVCRFLTGFDYGASDYEKATRIYDEITLRATYNRGKYIQADDEVYSILVNGTGKCVGFARAYKLLANAVGLKCALREDYVHMWNAVYIDGQAKSIDVSSTRTDACFYLDVVELKCPFCDYRNVFGLREVCHPCPNCKAQLYNPDMN